MSANLEVRISEHTGLPYTCVPGHAVWELVEYLAAQRTMVLYGYCKDGFTVTFQRLGKSAAQDLVDAWTASQKPDLAYQDAARRHFRNLCSISG